ncbi:MAG: hypothetical protein HS111_32670 [Kofleriaceae bacterium]|nr:hypothetical protein [Kofleriaceae bacterium]
MPALRRRPAGRGRSSTAPSGDLEAGRIAVGEQAARAIGRPGAQRRQRLQGRDHALDRRRAGGVAVAGEDGGGAGAQAAERGALRVEAGAVAVAHAVAGGQECVEVVAVLAPQPVDHPRRQPRARQAGHRGGRGLVPAGLELPGGALALGGEGRQRRAVERLGHGLDGVRIGGISRAHTYILARAGGPRSLPGPRCCPRSGHLSVPQGDAGRGQATLNDVAASF